MTVCSTLLLTATLFSAHTGSYDYRSENYGAGAECRMGRTAVAAGSYRNSYDKQSVYVLGALSVLQYRERAGVDLFAGPVTGYHDTPQRMYVAAGARLRFRMTNATEVAVLLTPAVGKADEAALLTLSYRVR